METHDSLSFVRDDFINIIYSVYDYYDFLPHRRTAEASHSLWLATLSWMHHAFSSSRMQRELSGARCLRGTPSARQKVGRLAGASSVRAAIGAERDQGTLLLHGVAVASTCVTASVLHGKDGL